MLRSLYIQGLSASGSLNKRAVTLLTMRITPTVDDRDPASPYIHICTVQPDSPCFLVCGVSIKSCRISTINGSHPSIKTVGPDGPSTAQVRGAFGAVDRQKSRVNTLQQSGIHSAT